MNNKDSKNLQDSLYSNILPPPPKLCNSIISRVLGGFCFGLNTNRSDECFIMTQKHHPEAFSGRHPEATAEGSMYILDSCLRLKQGSKNTVRHPEALAEGSIKDSCLSRWQASGEPYESGYSQSTHSLRMTQNSSLSLKDGRGEGWHWQKALKTAALTLALSFFIAAPVMAQAPVPAPAQTDNSAYTLTKVEQPGTNIITKYEWSETENKLVPQYYQVNLNKTEYGYPDVADDTKTFTVTTPNADGSGNAFEYEIKYYVDSSRLAPDRITTDQNGADISKDFVGNYASGDTFTSGGAIDNGYNSTIGDITGDFIGNYATVSGSYASAYGGAIYNGGSNATIGDITGDFIGNYATANYIASGGAIYNSKTTGDITGDFIGNYASGFSAEGGAIYNQYRSTIGDITGDFIGNYASSTNSSAAGGVIYSGHSSKIGNITGDFIGNYASSTSSSYSAVGGAIYITSGGGSKAILGNIIGNFIGNYASSTNSSASGGAIFNSGTIGKLDDDGNLVGGIYGSFINNYAKTESDSQLALGGAVYTFNDMNFIADNQINYFSGNYTQDYRGKINNAIFVNTSSSSSPTIKLQAQNNGVIIFDDQIDGGKSVENDETGKYEIDRTNAYNLALDGDNTGAIYLNDEIINANISVDKTR